MHKARWQMPFKTLVGVLAIPSLVLAGLSIAIFPGMPSNGTTTTQGSSPSNVKISSCEAPGNSSWGTSGVVETSSSGLGAPAEYSLVPNETLTSEGDRIGTQQSGYKSPAVGLSPGNGLDPQVFQLDLDCSPVDGSTITFTSFSISLFRISNSQDGTTFTLLDFGDATGGESAVCKQVDDPITGPYGPNGATATLTRPNSKVVCTKTGGVDKVSLRFKANKVPDLSAQHLSVTASGTIGATNSSKTFPRVAFVFPNGYVAPEVTSTPTPTPTQTPSASASPGYIEVTCEVLASQGPPPESTVTPFISIKKLRTSEDGNQWVTQYEEVLGQQRPSLYQLKVSQGQTTVFKFIDCTGEVVRNNVTYTVTDSFLTTITSSFMSVDLTNVMTLVRNDSGTAAPVASSSSSRRFVLGLTANATYTATWLTPQTVNEIHIGPVYNTGGESTQGGTNGFMTILFDSAGGSSTDLGGGAGGGGGGTTNSTPSAPTIDLSSLNGPGTSGSGSNGSNGSGGALATASAGQTFTLTGTGMNNVNQVNVGSKRAIITLKTATKLGFRLPKNLPAGTYDLSLYGSFGSMTEAKFFSVAKKKVTQVVAGFGGNSPALTEVVNAGISRTLARLGGGVTLVCNGSTSGVNVTKAAKELARDRARAACAEAKKANPSLTTKIRISPASAVGAQARNVKLVYRNY